ncbi:MAG: hypothetical protein ACREP1_07315, partial [Rhodanobacteraceae bacterium]
LRRRARSNLRHVSIDQPGDDGSVGLGQMLSDGAATPADLAEKSGQLALVQVALDFLLEKKRFQPTTVELFKAVALEEKDAGEVARKFQTTPGNVYEARRAITAKLRSMLRALEQGLDLEQSLAATS